MPKKSKLDATRLDEMNRTMYSSFCSAAKSLSQVYAQAMSHHKAPFQAGEHHALEKLYQWIVRQHEEGSRVTAADIVTHLQNVIDHGGDDALVSLRVQHPLASMHITTANSDEAKNSVFSNALSSPVRRSLKPYDVAVEWEGYYSSTHGHGCSSSSTHATRSLSP